MLNIIVSKIQECRNTGSYPNYPNFPPLQSLLSQCFSIATNFSPNREIKTCPYPEINGVTRQVIYIGINLQINFQQRVYPVVSKILFPPNFPNVPPIFSLANIREQDFIVNARYRKNFLPDRTHEVKLMSSYHWRNTLDFKSLITEFVNCLQQDFAFFKNTHKTQLGQSPRYYDPRYNEPNVKFPFDYDTGKEELNFQQPEYKDQPLQGNNMGYNPNQYNYNPQNSWPSQGKHMTEITKTIQEIQIEFIKDFQSLEKKQEVLCEINDRLNVRQNQIKEKLQQLPV